MRYALGMLFALTAWAVGPAVAQQNARALLQAADQAVGASKVNSVQFIGKGRFAYLGGSVRSFV
jgi:hypothetical protein